MISPLWAGTRWRRSGAPIHFGGLDFYRENQSNAPSATLDLQEMGSVTFSYCALDGLLFDGSSLTLEYCYSSENIRIYRGACYFFQTWFVFNAAGQMEFFSEEATAPEFYEVIWNLGQPDGSYYNDTLPGCKMQYIWFPNCYDGLFLKKPGHRYDIRNANFNNVYGSIIVQGPVYVYLSAVVGSGGINTYGITATDGATVQITATVAITGTLGDLKVGPLAVRTYTNFRTVAPIKNQFSQANTGDGSRIYQV